MFRRCSGVITSSSRAGFGGHRVRVCMFLPSLIADNEGSVILNHLIFTAGMSPTEAWWLMSGLCPNHPALRNSWEPASRLAMLCLFSNSRSRWQIEQAEEMMSECQVETFSVLHFSCSASLQINLQWAQQGSIQSLTLAVTIGVKEPESAPWKHSQKWMEKKTTWKLKSINEKQSIESAGLQLAQREECDFWGIFVISMKAT